ncbi:hypothetical protein SASPL_104039 [Salvia splendens]|uniref:Uncharacterized protein n=1 Tax=Salvia splendens TaxID=180675 RepID=A0A8X9A8Q0_SALSN|nr:hypothetical protein SASPL_104039 [Salvia splendens]
MRLKRGTYWGAASTPFCADAYLFVGPIFDDTNTLSHSLHLKKVNTILVEPDRVVIGDDGSTYDCVQMKDFLSALAGVVRRNETGFENHSRMYVGDGYPRRSEANEALRVNVLFQHIQKMLCGEMAVVAETGDSWFNCQKLKLPPGCLVDAICNGRGKCWTTKVGCEEELIEVIDGAMGANKDCLCFIEVMVHKDDTSRELLQMGTICSAANSRPPNIP